MRYFHRTSLPPDAVLVEADRYFAPSLGATESDTRQRTYKGNLGQVRLGVKAEGGHYTLVTVTTDQVGESEVDKLAKRFLAIVHQKVEPGHIVRGAY